MNRPITIIASRVLMALLFLLSGVSKVAAPAATAAYMVAWGVPGILMWPVAALEIGGGLALVFGFRLLWVAPALAVFSLAAAGIFHTHIADQIQLIMLLKNIAIAGGLLAIAANAKD